MKKSDIEIAEDELLVFVDDNICSVKGNEHFKHYHFTNDIIANKGINRLERVNLKNWIATTCGICIFSKEIQEEFENIWNDLNSAKYNIYSITKQETIFFNSKNEWIFYHSSSYRMFLYHYKYWKAFKNTFNIIDSDMSILTRFFIEQKLGPIGMDPGLAKEFDLEFIDRSLVKNGFPLR